MEKNVEFHSRAIVLLEGNLYNLEGKFVIKMDISVFFLQKYWKICKQIHILTQFLTIFQGSFTFSTVLKFSLKVACYMLHAVVSRALNPSAHTQSSKAYRRSEKYLGDCGVQTVVL